MKSIKYNIRKKTKMGIKIEKCHHNNIYKDNNNETFLSDGLSTCIIYYRPSPLLNFFFIYNNYNII